MLHKTKDASSPSHLVVLLCVSSGKNDEDLGSDEEQIVFLAYLLYDVTSNKVVSLQSHYVKPLPNDLSETILTEHCKLETSLDENRVKNGHPLDFVLEELDRFLIAKGVHPNHGGRSFIFLTDGPCPLRQCLHHESSSKNLSLASYFHRFFDIRREYSKRYDVGPINNIATMCDCHTFTEPQRINERLESGICTKSEVVDDNSVVRARGLPWQSSDQDIARFFKGLNIARGGVALCLSPQGRRNGEALIRFENEEQRTLALKRHKHHIGQRYIEVYKASGKDFINVAGGSSSEAVAFLSRGGQTILRMRGLPFSATTAQVLEFFYREPNACEVLDGEGGVLFVHYPDGRSTGDAFVLFASEEEASKALKKHRDGMGTRYIELFRSTSAEVQQVLNRSMDPRCPDSSNNTLAPTFLAEFPPNVISFVPQSFITAGSLQDCIRIRGLPPGVQVSDILTFLGELAGCIEYQGVHMVYTASGEPSGEAFIQLSSEQAASLTVQLRNRRTITNGNKKRTLDILQCSGDDMSLVLSNSLPSTLPLGLAPFVPSFFSHSLPAQIPLVSVASLGPIGPMQSIATLPLTSMTALPLTISDQQKPMLPGNRIVHAIAPSFFQLSPYSSQPAMITGSPGDPFGHLAIPTALHSATTPFQPNALFSQLPHPQPAFIPTPNAVGPTLLYWYPSPPVSPPGTITPFTLSGPCSVIMRGLPSTVTITDIVKYFQGFPEVNAENIQIQKNNDGKLTGDALLTFSTRIDAERAIIERNHRHIGSRFIELFMA